MRARSASSRGGPRSSRRRARASGSTARPPAADAPPVGPRGGAHRPSRSVRSAFTLLERGGRLGRPRPGPRERRTRGHCGPNRVLPRRPRRGASRRASSPTTPPQTDSVPERRRHGRTGDLPGRARLLRAAARACALDPIVERGETDYWIVFGDATNGRETYGGGRFVYAPPPVDGRHRPRLQQGLQPAVRLHAVLDLPAAAAAEPAADPRRGRREDGSLGA